jgi:hypothetical protein
VRREKIVSSEKGEGRRVKRVSSEKSEERSGKIVIRRLSGSRKAPPDFPSSTPHF